MSPLLCSEVAIHDAPVKEVAWIPQMKKKLSLEAGIRH
jgi:hypothetical protein